MATVWFTSDWHLDHKRICDFAGNHRNCDSVVENNHILVAQHRRLVRKRDRTYFLGDIAFSEESLELINELNGDKILVIGNHDVFGAEKYLEYFNDILGVASRNGFWLSHAPLHPAELRGKRNIHGHVHFNSIRDGYGVLDDRYINVCPEVTAMCPLSIDQIRNRIKQ